jgi:hypothetical protein
MLASVAAFKEECADSAQRSIVHTEKPASIDAMIKSTRQVQSGHQTNLFMPHVQIAACSLQPCRDFLLAKPVTLALSPSMSGCFN